MRRIRPVSTSAATLIVFAATLVQVGLSSSPTSASPFPSTDVPKTISNAAVVTSTVTVGAGIVGDVDVTGLSITHSFSDDLDVTLTSPFGTVVELFTDVCLISGRIWTPANTNFTLNQSAGASVVTACPPNGGSFTPEGNLNAFNGEPSGGTWTLTITDDFLADDGTLHGWGLDVDPALTLTVNSLTDTTDGACNLAHCSLREAITLSNGSSSTDETIAFNIPGAGPHTINPGSALPTITDTVTIDGYTQPGSAVNTSSVTDNAVIKIGLSGASSGFAHGLVLSAPNSVVQGLAVHTFDNGIRTTTNDITIRGSFIGTNPGGASGLGNARGVAITGDSDFITVGGPALAHRNVISGNAIFGVSVEGVLAQSNQVTNNFIGMAPNGTAPLPNTSGVFVDQAHATFVTANTISGNTSQGIHLEDITSGVTIMNNKVGLEPFGITPEGNGGNGVFSLNSYDVQLFGNVIGNNGLDGVFMSNTQNAVFGGNRIGVGLDESDQGNDDRGITMDGSSDAQIGTVGSSGSGNTIAYNGLAGIRLDGTSNRVRIRRNSIHSNAGLGIDLAPGGINPNDAELDEEFTPGPNELQNFPVVTSATSAGGVTRIRGSLHTSPEELHTVLFYASPVCDGAGYGEGQQFVGAASVATDDAGNVNFDEEFGVAVDDGWVVTGTANDTEGNTSEFSACETVVGEADLDLMMAESADPIAAGSSVTYTSTITNHGPETAEGVTFTQNVPAGATFVSSNASQGGCSGTVTVTCNLGSLNDDASATVDLVVSATSGPLTTMGEVTGDGLDTVSSNNEDTETTTVTGTTRTLTVINQGTGTGSVASVPSGAVACPGDCTEGYPEGTVVTLRATAGTNSVFTGWSGACTNRVGDCTVTMSANRTVRATFLACTVLGTSGNNVLTGTKTTNDVICGLGGNDTLTGLEGNDVLDGGAGNDTLLGGKGSDLLLGGANVDTATFGDSGVAEGVDVDLGARTAFSTTLGNDLFGLDTSTNQADVENIEGSPFADSINGGTANNTLNGKEGDDTIDGGGGNDILTGGDGADELNGDAGNDRIQPGLGTDSADGGSGTADILDYGNGITGGGVTVNLTTQTASEPGASDSISSFESVFGSPFDDNLTGSALVANILTGGLGADTLTSTDGDVLDTIAGGADAVNDTCSADPGDTVLQCP